MKSKHGVPANNHGTKMQISQEEWDFRWDYASHKYPNMSVDEFNKRITEFRRKTGKPNNHTGRF